MRARPDSGCGQPECQVCRSRQRQEELTAVTEARKAGWAGAVPGAVVAKVGCGWPVARGSARSGEQAATHSTVNAALPTSRPRLLTIPGS